MVAQIPFNGFPRRVVGRSTAVALRVFGAVVWDSIKGRLHLEPLYIPMDRELLSNPKAKVLAVTVKIVNGSSKTFDLSVTLDLVYGQDGREAEAFFDSGKGLNGIDSPSRLRPKRAVTGKFAFEVPSSNVKDLVFEGAPGFDYDAQQWTV